jgi:DNA-binding beta-propeller fold protein YncE
VVVDDDDNILVVDSWNNRIQKFTSGGRFILASPDNLGLCFPKGIAIHPRSNKLYVAASKCITILNPNLTFSSKFGCSNYGEFNAPSDVAFDSTGKVYVTDMCNHRIPVFTAEGKYLRQFGRKGRGRGELDYPTGICIDKEDVVYVTEEGNHRVSLFKSDGTHIKSFGSEGCKIGQFSHPCGIALDKDENVYVADKWLHRVQKF